MKCYKKYFWDFAICDELEILHKNEFIKERDFQVFIMLYELSSDRCVQISKQKLADEMNRNLKYVTEGLKNLKTHGYISITSITTIRRKKLANAYRIFDLLDSLKNPVPLWAKNWYGNG